MAENSKIEWTEWGKGGKRKRTNNAKLNRRP